MNKLKNSTVILTGASGFIGSRLCTALGRLGIVCKGLNTSTGNIEDPAYFDALTEIEAGCMIHLAAKSFVPESWVAPAQFVQTNLIGTINALEFAKERKLPFIYLSAYVYGTDHKEKISERIPPSPSNPYALSKKMGEDACLFYQDKFSLPVTIIRPFNIYGPGQKEGFLLPSLLQQLKKSDEINVRSLSPRRDYLHVDDLVALLVLSIQGQEPGIFNAGTGISTSVAEVIKMLERITGKKIRINNLNQARIHEIDDTRADISAAIRAFGWRPRIDLETGLRKLWEDS